jgi:hypothetical protein
MISSLRIRKHSQLSLEDYKRAEVLLQNEKGLEVKICLKVFRRRMVLEGEEDNLEKVAVEILERGKELFVGWGSTVDTGPYIDSVQFETPHPAWEWNYGLYWASITVGGTGIWNSNPPAVLPSDEGFWIYSAQTSSSVTIPIEIHWDNATSGNRALLIMNADGTPNVQADVQFGAKIPMLSWLPFVLVPVGVALTLVGVALYRRRAKWYTPGPSA